MSHDADRIVLRSASVYSPTFPHASAMIIDAGMVSWVGDDDGLDGQGIVDATDIDCAGAFVGPAFFDAARGGSRALPVEFGGAVDTGVPPVLITRDSHGETQRSEVSDLLDSGVSLASRNTTMGERTAAYASSRCGDDPWDWIRERVASQTLTTRAGFTAATRAGWRMVGAPMSGQLVPGVQARLCVWRCASLQASAADERVARWSTDPRSGTPPLPDLGQGLPELALAIHGRRIFQAAA